MVDYYAVIKQIKVPLLPLNGMIWIIYVWKEEVS